MEFKHRVDKSMIPTVDILGVNIAAIDMQWLLNFTHEHIKELSGDYIAVANVHTTVTASEDEEYLAIQNGGIMAIPDGGPLSTVGRKKGAQNMHRTTGPSYMEEILKVSEERGYRHFFYGSTPETLEKLRSKLLQFYPNLQIAGMYSPPFRPLTEEEDTQITEQINTAEPDFLWVGLGAPKQEIWMAEHQGKVKGLMVGVGAAFDFFSGNLERAPMWMQNRNLEWFFRLLQEPKRLFKRYLYTNTKFILREYLGIGPKHIKKKSDGKQHVFLVGAKSLGAYGGYETFINKLTEYHQNEARIQYHVACKANGQGYMDETTLEGVTRISDFEFYYHNAHCFKIRIPEAFGSAQALYYDIMSLKKCCDIIRQEDIPNPIVYIMACRIGPVIKHYYNRIHKLGGRVYLNPDGHEWLRAKWSAPVRKYWKVSEKMMVKYSDLVICDSVNIEKYIHSSYDGKGIRGASPKTTYIAYGAETRKSQLADHDEKFTGWLEAKGLKPREYYLVVGRFVPENNYETMIREFMKSHSSKNLAIITNKNDYLMSQLDAKLHFRQDSRIKFVGTVYDQELLMKIRENAYGYFHGHEVGGTNPSLLEALGSTKLNLLLGVGFNREVAEDAALYWSKDEGNLAALIDSADNMPEDSIVELGIKARKRIVDNYSWKSIADSYKRVIGSV